MIGALPAAANKRLAPALLLWATAALPFTGAIIGPLLPLLIVFAGTLPATAPQGNKPLALAIAALLLAAAACTSCALILQRFRSFPRALVAPLIAVIVTECAATAVGLNFSAGLFSIACQLLGILALAAGVIVLAQDGPRRWFIACYLIAASAAAVFAMVLSIMRQPPAMFAYEHGRASGTFLQPNEFAGFLLFVIPIALAQSAAPRWLRIIGWLSAIIGIGGLILSVSRAAIVSLLCGLLVYVRRFGRRALIMYFVFAMTALLISIVAFRNVAHDPSENASRIAIWAGALRLAQRFALTGAGPLAFHVVYPALKLPDVVTDEVHAHSLPLQLLIENGVLGLAAVGWLVWASIKAAAQAGRQIAADDREKILLFTAVAAGFAASALQNLIDVVTTFLLIASWPALSLLFALGNSQDSKS